MRSRPTLGLALALALAWGAGAPAACTGSREPSVPEEPKAPPGAAREPGEPVTAELSVPARPHDEVPRNSDGSPQILPPGPPSRLPYTLVLAYDDFGPQAMAFELIGMDWWQWEGGGSWEPGDRFDVRVVVYRGTSLAAVRAEYPTLEGRADYRYVSYDEAMAYFERSLKEIEAEPTLRDLHERLVATRSRIRQALGGGAVPP